MRVVGVDPIIAEIPFEQPLNDPPCYRSLPVNKCFFPTLLSLFAVTVLPFTSAAEQCGLKKASSARAKASKDSVEHDWKSVPVFNILDESDRLQITKPVVKEQSKQSEQNELKLFPKQAQGQIQLVSVAFDPQEASNSRTVACPTCDCQDCCCESFIPVSRHRSGIFAEALHLMPSNVDVVYALEQTDPDPLVANPTGPTGRISLDADAAIRGGFTHALSDCTSVMASYTWFETGTTSQINATPGNVLHSRIIHPSTLTSGAASTQATASYDLSFQRVELDYRMLLWGNRDAAINFSGGVRYANLDEQFESSQTIAVATGLTTVTTDIDFDGFGIGLGLDAEKRSCTTGLLCYGKAGASFLQGEFKADYLQSNQFGGGTIGDTLRDSRFVSILDLELGVGWQNDCGTCRVTAGYVASGWFNTVTTDSYVQGFRAGVLEDLSETLALSGLVGRIEYRY